MRTALAFALLTFAGVRLGLPADPSPRPNFVVILTDDLDMSQVRYMPRVNAELVRRGMTFSESFVSDPICTPSRASLLTGRYAHNHQVRENIAPLGGFKAFERGGLEGRNLAVWLEAAGYRTGLLGKYLNGYPTPRDSTHVPRGWTDWFALTAPEYFDYTVNDNGKTRSFDHAPADYQTDVLSGRAVQFVESADPRPFFLFVAPHAPHLPAIPPPRYEEALNDTKPPRPASYDEADVSRKPRYIRDLPRLTPAVKERTDNLYVARAESLLAVDDLVQAVLRTLETKGLLDRTYVFFSSDNGFEFGAHRMDHGKGDPYEASIRVPLLVRGPRIGEGSSSDAFVSNVDLAPTLLDLAGVRSPEVADGRSLGPILLGERPSWRSEILLEGFGGPEDDVPGYQGLRTRSHVYVEYVTGEKELYDLRNDPDELHNLAPQSLPVGRELKERLAALKQCAGDSCWK
jgi:N-acetylglucosamine-6-sulfatase